MEKTTAMITVWCIIQNRGQAYDAFSLSRAVTPLLRVSNCNGYYQRPRQRWHRIGSSYKSKKKTTSHSNLWNFHSSRILIILSLTNIGFVTIFPVAVRLFLVYFNNHLLMAVRSANADATCLRVLFFVFYSSFRNKIKQNNNNDEKKRLVINTISITNLLAGYLISLREHQTGIQLLARAWTMCGFLHLNSCIQVLNILGWCVYSWLGT